MITAWSPSGMQRSRSTAVLWRLLGLGFLLFGVLYTHAVTPDSTVRHLPAGVGIPVSGDHFEPAADGETVASATSVAASETPDDPSEDHHGGGHGQHHAGAECALAQPPQGPGVALPCMSTLSSEIDGSVPSRSAYARRTAARDFGAPTAHAADSAVLRI